MREAIRVSEVSGIWEMSGNCGNGRLMLTAIHYDKIDTAQWGSVRRWRICVRQMKEQKAASAGARGLPWGEGARRGRGGYLVL